MEQISIKAYGKVNLGLDVTGKRKDGYHLLNMVMQTVPVWDEVCISIGDRNSREDEPRMIVSCDHPGVPTDSGNLAYKAAQRICDKYSIREDIHIDIKKNIPMGAGMAGGSADGAAVIQGLNELFALGMDPDAMDALAVTLGADVPFCLRHGTYHAQGIGEVLTRLPDLMHCYMVLIKPEISISTPWAYQNLDRLLEEAGSSIVHPDIDAIIQAIKAKDVQALGACMGNILEDAVIGEYVEIARIKQELLDAGASGAMMSGSGSVVFGIFTDENSANAAFSNIGGGNYGKFKVEF